MPSKVRIHQFPTKDIIFGTGRDYSDDTPFPAIAMGCVADVVRGVSVRCFIGLGATLGYQPCINYHWGELSTSPTKFKTEL